MFRLIPYRKLNGNVMPKDDIFDQFFDNFIEDLFEPMNKVDGRFNNFHVDVIDRDGKYVIVADLPGFDKENVTIEYENNYLTISAKKDEVIDEEKENFIRRERRVGEFRRSFYVENIEVDDIEAEFKNGVLSIELKKSNPSNNKKLITIK